MWSERVTAPLRICSITEPFENDGIGKSRVVNMISLSTLLLKRIKHILKLLSVKCIGDLDPDIRIF